MEPDVVKNYISKVRLLKPSFVLLRNMREGKQKKSSTNHGVSVPIKSDHYLAMFEGYTLVDRLTQPFGFLTVDGFNSELILLRA